MIKTSKARVMIARFLLPLLVVWLAIFPSRSYAFVPAAIGGYGLPAGVPAAAGFVGAIDFFAAGGVVAIGALAGYMVVDYFTDQQGLRLPLTANPNAVPPPDAPPTADPTPGTSQYRAVIGPLELPTDGGSTPEAACAAVGGTIQGNGTCQLMQATCVAVGYTASGCYDYINVPIGSKNFVVPPSCEPGYELVGEVCELADATQATRDGNKDYGREGTVLTPKTDADDFPSGLQPQPDGTYLQPGTHNGNPASIEIAPKPEGGSEVTACEQQVVGGQTVVVCTTTTIDPSGVVVSVVVNTYMGSLPADGAQPAPDTPTLSFPSDYSRQGEAQAAADSLAPKLDRIGDALTATGSAVDPVEPLPESMPWFDNTFAALSGWTMPGHVSTCPTPSVDLSMVLGAGHVFTMSDHCALFQDNAASMRAAAITGWLILALFVFLRA